MAKHRIHPGLAALSASAIAAVYAVGYVHTQPAADSVANATAQVAIEPTLMPTAAPTISTPSGAAQIVVPPTATPLPSVTSMPTATATSVTAVTAAYKDGTYSGMGTSRFGNVEVAVTVAGSKITDVALTRVTTKYPASRIAALPAQVVSRQGPRVDNVSGATASATAFRTAVQAALAKAA